MGVADTDVTLCFAVLRCSAQRSCSCGSGGDIAPQCRRGMALRSPTDEQLVRFVTAVSDIMLSLLRRLSAVLLCTGDHCQPRGAGSPRRGARLLRRRHSTRVAAVGWTAYTPVLHSLGERRVVAAQWSPRWEASLCRAVQWVLRVGYGHASVSVVDSWRIVVYSKAWTDDTVGADATVDTRGHGQVCCDAHSFCCPS